MTKTLPGSMQPEDLDALLPTPQRAGMFGARSAQRQNLPFLNVTPSAFPYPFGVPASGLDANATDHLLGTVPATLPLTVGAWAHAANNGTMPDNLDVQFSAPSPVARAPHYRQPPPEIIALAQASQRATGIPASVNIAQWIHEGAWGEHTPKDSNNFFGYKEYDRKQPNVLAKTTEYDAAGKPHKKWESFRIFQSPQEGWAAHTRLLTNDPRYAKAMTLTHDPDAFIDAIAGTYAPKIQLCKAYKRYHAKESSLSIQYPTTIGRQIEDTIHHIFGFVIGPRLLKQAFICSETPFHSAARDFG